MKLSDLAVSFARPVCLVAVATLALSSCTDPEKNWEKETQTRHDASLDKITSKMPEGCILHDLGVYETLKRDHIPIIVVDCQNSTTVNGLQRVGKSTRPVTVAKVK